MLYTITTQKDDGANFTYQIEGPDERETLRLWAELNVPNAGAVRVQLVGQEVRDLPVPAHGVLTVTPMEGLRNVWYFYGALDNEMIDGLIVATA